MALSRPSSQSDPFNSLRSSLRSLLDSFNPQGGGSEVEDFTPSTTVGLPRGGALTDFFQPLQKLQQVIPQVKMDITDQGDNSIRLNVENGLLTLTAEKKDEHEEKKEQGNYRVLRREIGYGTVTRQIRLPDDAQAEQVNAKLNDGVLDVEIPKKKGAPQKKGVNIE